MANLLSTLISSASTLNAYSQVMEVTQNNVANASTPGFAKQTLPLEAMSMDINSGLSGGVAVGQVQSARDEFAEQAVRTQQTSLGNQQQAVTGLTSLQSVFDISGNSGIDKALNDFFQSVSAWGQTPSDETARQSVITSATEVAQGFQDAASAIQQLAQQNQSQLSSTVTQINQIVSQIQTCNQTALQTGASTTADSGVDAQVHAGLENLSQLADVTASEQQNGTVSVFINGNTPLLVGNQQYTLQAGLTSGGADPAYPDAPASEQVTVAGADITAQTTGGQLGAVLDMGNRILPSYIGSSSQPGGLNTMAKQFADCVNQLLTSGNISDGPPPVTGVPLFTYDTTNDTNVAQTLAVDPSVTTDQLAAISPGPPEVANGVPLALSQLATPQNASQEIDGFSYTQYYGNMAANIGSQLQNAQNNVQVDQSLLSQAQNQRQQLSGVDLNEEAMTLVEFQRGYQANCQFITILDQLTLDTINILGAVS